ncbi:hypothetical protein [Mesorhizobium sp. RCC_202]
MEKFIQTSVGSGRGEPIRVIFALTKTAKVAEFQPDMVKIGFSKPLL